MHPSTKVFQIISSVLCCFQTMKRGINLEEKFCGCLLASALGDAIGEIAFFLLPVRPFKKSCKPAPSCATPTIRLWRSGWPSRSPAGDPWIAGIWDTPFAATSYANPGGATPRDRRPCSPWSRIWAYPIRRRRAASSGVQDPSVSYTAADY